MVLRLIYFILFEIVGNRYDMYMRDRYKRIFGKEFER